METKELWDLYDENGVLLTGKAVRGEALPSGTFHLVVNVWVINSQGEFLLSRRTPNKPYGDLWETTGGSALAGEDSLTCAVREVYEELGVRVKPEEGVFFRRVTRRFVECPDHMDVWVFRKDMPLEEVVFQEGETQDAMYADADKIRRMLEEGTFIPVRLVPYLEDFFAAMERGSGSEGWADGSEQQ